MPPFHSCPIEPSCAHCTGQAVGNDRFDWSFLDGVYCISLRERADRAATAAAQFHRVGLCRYVRFYRPTRHPSNPVIGIWESHRTIARDALSHGHARVLVLEDDVRFTRMLRPEKVSQIARILDVLPDGWRVFYLGHWPLKARFVRPDVLQTQSACTHAYVANRLLLQWLSEERYRKTTVDYAWRRWVGGGLDAAFANLPGTYALFPMVATQSCSPSDHLRPGQRGRIQRVRHVITRTRLREWLLSTMMRPNELLVALRALRSEPSEYPARKRPRPRPQS